MKQTFITVLKGMWIGGTLTVPGVSGGTMAMMLGIYEQLIHAFNYFFTKKEERKKNFFFLLQFVLGAGIGMLALSGIVVKLLDLYPAPMTFFFMGAVAGGIPVFVKDIGKQKVKGVERIYIAMHIQPYPCEQRTQCGSHGHQCLHVQLLRQPLEGGIHAKAYPLG